MPPARGLMLLYSASEVLPVPLPDAPRTCADSLRSALSNIDVYQFWECYMCGFGTGARTLLLLAMSLVEITVMGPSCSTSVVPAARRAVAVLTPFSVYDYIESEGVVFPGCGCICYRVWVCLLSGYVS